MKVNIYHTNDIHSNYEFLKRVYDYMQKNKKENDFYFDSGDYTDLKSVIVQADNGQAAMRLLSACKLDGITIGNNEVDLSYEAVIKFVEMGCPFVSTNVTDNNDKYIPGIKASKIYEKVGKRFLVLGIAPFYNEYMEDGQYNIFSMMGNLKFHPPIEPLRKEIDMNAGKYDYCILLSHSGFTVDKEILKLLPEVDLCLGGHSHDIKNYKGYSQSGMGECLGKITLEIEVDSITEICNEQLKLETVENSEFDNIYSREEKLANQLLSKELTLFEELEFNPFMESGLNNFICDCLLKKFGGDLAIMHAGISEGSLVRPVSRKSLVELFPSKLNPTIYSINGEKIIEAVKLSFDEEHIKSDGRGPGFRGTILGTLGFSSNVRISKNPFNIEVNGEPIDLNRKYKIVTDDYLQRGTGYPSLKVSNEESEYHIWFIRDLVQNFLMDEEIFLSSQIKRIT